MTGNGPSPALAAFVADGASLATGPAAELALEAIGDCLGCALAGHGDRVSGIVRRAEERSGEGPCSVLGSTRRLPAAAAAMVNGTAAHALDLDDNFGPMFGHASAVLVPPLLALAEERDATLADLVDVYLIGLEVARFVGEAVSIEHYRRGWHATSTIGAIAAAAAVARLMRLDSKHCLSALSIATSLASGSKQQFGFGLKAAHAGLAARAGLIAAFLASDGLDTTPEPLAGPWGFVALFGGSPEGIEQALAGLAAVRAGGPPAIVTHGLKPKLHPCCASAHAALDALLDLARLHDLAAGEIAAVTVELRRTSFDNLPFADPADPMQARFSLPYALAAGLAGGGLRLADFTPPAVARTELRPLMARITMRVADTDSPLADPTLSGEPALVRIELQDGRRLERLRRYQRGVRAEPFTLAERRRKLADCLAASPLAARTAEAVELLLAPDPAMPVRELMAALTPSGR
ncbi:MmgE/PrpD family protein [Geminicoccaceae bacterium 1502E]|nr:MmgE/PrpD family protein [Geminicoccaceae bacterium 1502E]